MKKLLFLLLLACVLASCASHRLTNAEKYPALSGMINAYYYRYYEYPSSADELITFTNVYREYWSKESVKDSIETTLNHLQKEKEIPIEMQNMQYTLMSKKRYYNLLMN